MQAMIIDDNKIEALKVYAEAHPIAVAEMWRVMNDEAPCAGDRAGHMIDIPPDFKLVYSIEETPTTDGTPPVWLRRMSMSSGRPDKYPHPAALEVIGGKLGFPPLDECWVTIDQEQHAVVVANYYVKAEAN
jgi:hypothetical protein